MKKPRVTAVINNPGSSTISEVHFTWEGKEHKATPLKGDDVFLSKYHNFLRKAEKEGINPFTYKNIDRLLVDGKIIPRNKKEPQEAEQMSFLSELVDKVADSLERKGLVKEAKDLDIIANTLDKIAEDPHEMTQIVFDNPMMRELWENDIKGQISDGAWENTADQSEWLWKYSGSYIGDENKIYVKDKNQIGKKDFNIWEELSKTPDIINKMLESIKKFDPKNPGQYVNEEKYSDKFNEEGLHFFLDKIEEMIRNPAIIS